MPALIIFTKNPQLGRVKTRLAQDIGKEKALKIYQLLVDHTRRAVMSLKVDIFIFYDKYVDEHDSWQEIISGKLLQKGNTLGEKMMTAFEEIFSHDHNRVVIIGTDCPDISEEIIKSAFDMLKDTAVVIGPAVDGGYYLLGLRRMIPELFQDIDWSTPKVMEQTVRIIEEQKIEYALLTQLRDIDVVDDLEHYPYLKDI